MRHFYLICLPLLLTGCLGSGLEDLEEYVRTSDKDMRGNIPPAPDFKPPEVFPYKNDSVPPLPDPFQPRKQPKDKDHNTDRPKEELENFPLENLKMVGFLEQKGIPEAVIRTPDSRIFRVKVGNHIGTKFGEITAISADGIVIKEIIREGDDATVHDSILKLDEPGVTQ